MIRHAPLSRQPATAPSPTRPAPNTTHVEPSATFAVLSAAPIPVESPQAKTHARSSGASGEIFASAISGITVYSAKVDVPMKCRIGSPPRDRRVVPSGRKPWFCCSRIQAVRALTALRREERHDVVTGRDGTNAFTHRLDNAGTLVPQHRRRVPGGIGSGCREQVGMADAAGGE